MNWGICLKINMEWARRSCQRSVGGWGGCVFAHCACDRECMLLNDVQRNNLMVVNTVTLFRRPRPPRPLRHPQR